MPVPLGAADARVVAAKHPECSTAKKRKGNNKHGFGWLRLRLMVLHAVNTFTPSKIPDFGTFFPEVFFLGELIKTWIQNAGKHRRQCVSPPALRFSLVAFCNGTVKAFMDTMPFFTPTTRTWSLKSMVPERLLLIVFDFHWVCTTRLLDFFTPTCKSGILKLLKFESIRENCAQLRQASGSWVAGPGDLIRMAWIMHNKKNWEAMFLHTLHQKT